MLNENKSQKRLNFMKKTKENELSNKLFEDFYINFESKWWQNCLGKNCRFLMYVKFLWRFYASFYIMSKLNSDILKGNERWILLLKTFSLFCYYFFKTLCRLYSQQQNNSSTCDNTCNFSLVCLPIFTISCLL